MHNTNHRSLCMISFLYHPSSSTSLSSDHVWLGYMGIRSVKKDQTHYLSLVCLVHAFLYPKRSPRGSTGHCDKVTQEKRKHLPGTSTIRLFQISLRFSAEQHRTLNWYSFLCLGPYDVLFLLLIHSYSELVSWSEITEKTKDRLQ